MYPLRTAERPRQIQLAFRRLASFFAVVELLARRERMENFFFLEGGGGNECTAVW